MSSDDIATIIIIFLIFGGGEVLVRMFAPMLSGRRTIAKLKAENRALRRSVEHLEGSVTSMMQSGVKVVTNPQHEALLYRVQATDDAVPQLPQGLRADIDAALATAITTKTKKG